METAGNEEPLSDPVGAAATVATCTAAPLLSLSVVTMAVREPEPVGSVVKETESEVAVAEVIVATAPSLNATELLPAEESKPNPSISSVVGLAGMLAVFCVTTGMTVCRDLNGRAAALGADGDHGGQDPAVVGSVVNVTDSEVAVEAVT